MGHPVLLIAFSFISFLPSTNECCGTRTCSFLKRKKNVLNLTGKRGGNDHLTTLNYFIVTQGLHFLGHVDGAWQKFGFGKNRLLN